MPALISAAELIPSASSLWEIHTILVFWTADLFFTVAISAVATLVEFRAVFLEVLDMVYPP